MAKDEPAPTPEARDTLARLLGENTEAVVNGLGSPGGMRSVMSPLVAARAAADAVDEATRVLVREARGAGHS